MNRHIQALSLLLVGLPLLFGQTNGPFAVKTLAGSYSIGDGGPATAALLVEPAAVTTDSTGNLYIADGNTNGVRKVSNSFINPYSAYGFVDVKMDSSGNL